MYKQRTEARNNKVSFVMNIKLKVSNLSLQRFNVRLLPFFRQPQIKSLQATEKVISCCLHFPLLLHIQNCVDCLFIKFYMPLCT